MLAVIIKFWPMMVATALYVGQTAIFLWTRQWGAAITFIGYAMANIGLIWSLS